MADNIVLNAGSGGSTVRTDDDGTSHWQYVKLAYGADNTQNIVTSTATNPLPVALSDTDNAVLDSMLTALQLIDNAVSGAGFNITQLGGAAVPIGAGVESTALRVTIATDSTGVLSIDDNGGSLTVDGTVTANLSATDNAVLDAIAASVAGTLTVGSHAVTNAGTFAVQVDGAALTALQLIDNAVHVDDAAFTAGTDSGVMIMGYAGAQTVNSGDAAALACNTSGVLHVNLNSQTSDITIADGGNTITVDWAASTNTIEVVGDVAHDAAMSGNPVAMAVRATNSIEGLTQVAAADSSYVTSDLNGCLVTRPHTTLEEVISERVSNTDGASTAFSNFGAGGAGVHNYVTTFSVWNSSATDGYVDIRDGTAGSILFTLPAPTLGGSVHNFPLPLKQTTANTALAYDVSGALSTVYISAIGFQAQG